MEGRLCSQLTSPGSVLPPGLLTYATVFALDPSPLSRALVPFHHLLRCWGFSCPPWEALLRCCPHHRYPWPAWYLAPNLPAPRVLCWTFYRPGAWMGASPWLSISEPWRPCYAQGPLIEGGRQGPQAAGVSLSAVSEAGGPTWHCIDPRTPDCLVW